MMHKVNKKNDLRVKRTEKVIFEALIALTIKKGFSAVTVSDITQAASINRATFYRHYKDKFDLLNQYTQNVYSMLDIQSTRVKKRDYHSLPKNLVNIFEHVRENAIFYRVMLGQNGDPEFTEKIRTYIKKRIRSSLPVDLKADEKMIDLFITYSANASFGAILWWLEHNMPYSSEKMIHIIYQLEKENLQILLD
ncbi:MAG TPA: TetR/AcrR family transcriptional regulator [Candidatus Saccharimonadales bacterium]|nr:TetR/AcrR family transcriptional regulator [Candidatus Saccharimonadales bacterium]